MKLFKLLVSGIHMLIFCLLAKITRPFSFQGNIIHDLEGSGTNFIAESSSWRCASKISPTIQTCGQIYSFCDKIITIGGPDLTRKAIYFKREYKNLPPHDIIYFSIQISLIDAWKPENTFVVLFNSETVANSYFIGSFDLDASSDFLENKCGDPSVKDLDKLKIYGKASHQDYLLRLQISLSSGDYETSSLGFRDLTLLFRNFTEEEKNLQRAGGWEQSLLSEFCGIANIQLPINECQCPEGQYKASDGSCQLCDPACKICLGPSPSQCLECVKNAFFDGVECKLCHESCATCFGASANQCSSCPEHYFLFEGSSCVSSCTSPLVPTSVGLSQYCSFPCPSDKYLYPDGECKSTCNFTYNSIIFGNRRFCSFFCPVDEFYVSVSSSEIANKGTCLENCPSGYYKDNQAKYCIPCQDRLCASCPTDHGAKCQECLAEAILDSNGICKDCRSMVVTDKRTINLGHQYLLELFPETCDLDPAIIQNKLLSSLPSNTSLPPFFFHVESNRGNKYIINLILGGSLLGETSIDLAFYHLNGSLVIPKKIIPNTQLQEIAEYAPTVQTVLTSIVTFGFLGALILGSTVAIWSIIGFQQFIGYLQYVNIEFPFQVNIFFSLLGSSTWNFLPNLLSHITQPLTKAVSNEFNLQSPQKFIEKEISPSFIQNGGGIILIHICLLILLGIVILFRRLYKSKKIRLLKILIRTLRWNVILRTYLITGIPLTLAILLQLRSLSFVSAYLTLGSAFSLFSCLYLGCFLTFLQIFLYDKTVNQLKKDILAERYGTLWEGIVLKESPSKYYHLIIFIRGILLSLLVVFLEQFPILQIMPLILYNVGLILYLLKEVEFEDSYLSTINKVKEILVLIGEMFILGLAFKNGSEHYYNNLGWLVVICFLSGLVIETGYIIGKQIMGIKATIKKVQSICSLAFGWLKKKPISTKASKEEYCSNIVEQVPIVMELGNFRTEDQKTPFE